MTPRIYDRSPDWTCCECGAQYYGRKAARGCCDAGVSEDAQGGL